MRRAIVVRGTLSDPRHIELDEAVSDIQGPVEVTVRAVQDLTLGSPQAVLQVLRALPNLEEGDVDELERMIDAGTLPTRAGGLFDADA